MASHEDALDDEFVFAEEDESAATPTTPDAGAGAWSVLIVDDDRSIHEATRLVLRHEKLNGRPIEILSAYSAAEARDKLIRRPDIAFLIVDVVLETERAGLDLIRWLREERANHITRVALRTGHFGLAPQAEVMRDYAINDYWPKTEMSAGRLINAILAGLRTYREMLTLHSVEAGPSLMTLTDAEPRRLGRYVVLERTGSGGIGVVYAAYDPQLDRKVAVKLMHAGSVNQRAQQRLLREARAMARLSHPNVVAVYDVGIQEGRIFVAMDFIRGITLTQWLQHEPRTRDEILETFGLAGRGLAAAHEAGLVHRDFKPENVLVGRKRGVKVTDFGIAQAISPASSIAAKEALPELTSFLERIGHRIDDSFVEHGLLMGTPNYMAPEQHLGGEADARADQFSYCLALWEALYGARPFKGETLTMRLAACYAGEFAEPQNRLRVPRRIRAALERGLSWQAERRWPSMHALLAALGSRSRSSMSRRLAVVAAGLVVVGAGVAALQMSGSGSRSDVALFADAYFELARRSWTINRVKAIESAWEAIHLYRGLGPDYEADGEAVVTWLRERGERVP